jgi:hypothetical protein
MFPDGAHRVRPSCRIGLQLLSSSGKSERILRSSSIESWRLVPYDRWRQSAAPKRENSPPFEAFSTTPNLGASCFYCCFFRTAALQKRKQGGFACPLSHAFFDCSGEQPAPPTRGSYNSHVAPRPAPRRNEQPSAAISHKFCHQFLHESTTWLRSQRTHLRYTPEYVRDFPGTI